MTYTKLPEEALHDERLVNLSDKAYRLYINGFLYSNAHLTDGYVPRGMVSMLVPEFRPRGLSELLQRRLWLRKPGGYYIVGFTDHQLTKAQLDELRRQKAEAGRAGGVRSGEVRRLRFHRSNGEVDAEASAEAETRHPLHKREAPAQAETKPVPRTPYSVSGEVRGDADRLRDQDGSANAAAQRGLAATAATLRMPIGHADRARIAEQVAHDERQARGRA